MTMLKVYSVLFVIFLSVHTVFSAAREVQIFNRATAYYQEGAFKKAIILFRKAGALGLDPSVIAFNIGNSYFQQGDLPSAAAAYKRSYRLSGGTRYNALFNYAGVQYRLKNYGEAIASYRRALKEDPGNGAAWLYLAESYQKVNDLVGAQRALEKARDLSPDDAGIIYQLAEIHVALGEIKQGITLVEQAYTVLPEETDFLFYIGDLYTLAKDFDGAVRAYRNALIADPDNYSGHYRLADILVESGQSFLAIEHLNEALDIKPDYSDAALFLGNVTFDLKWYDRALDAYKQAFEYGDTEGVYGMVNLVYEHLARKDSVSAAAITSYLKRLQNLPPLLKTEVREAVAAVGS